MGTAVAGKGLEGVVARTPGSAGSTETRGSSLTAASTSMSWPSTRPSRRPPTCCGTACCPTSLPCASSRRSWLWRAPRPPRHRPARNFPTPPRHGGAAHRGVGIELLRCRRKGQRARRQRAQGLQTHGADGMIVAITTGCARVRKLFPRPLALSRRQLPLDAEWRIAVGNRHAHIGHRPRPARRHELNASTFAARVIALRSPTSTPPSLAPSARSRGRCTAAQRRRHAPATDDR